MSSLRRQLLWRLLPPMVMVMLAAGTTSYYMSVRESDRLHDRWLLDSARALGEQVKFDGSARIEMPRAVLEMLEWDEQDTIYYRVHSSTGGFLMGHKDLPVATGFLRDRGAEFFDLRFQGRPIRMVVLMIERAPQGERVIVEVAETLRKRHAHAQEMLAAAVVPQLVLVVLVWVLVYSGVRSGLRPLKELEAAVHARSPSDLNPLPEAKVPAEVSGLTRAIDGLLSRLNDALDAQQRFIADASHQLRTPLAALKVQLQRSLREHDSQAREQALGQVLKSTERAVHLSNQLLLLARAEPGSGGGMNPRWLDLCRLAHEVGGPWAVRAAQQGCDLGLEVAEEPVRLRGDAVLLGELINNLLDNALRYAGPGARITLRVGVDAGASGGAQLLVEDDGPGVPEPERAAIFERFYRVAGALGEGTGLGLAIAREIARAHGAEIVLDSPAAGGACFRVSFPASSARALSTARVALQAY